MMDISNVNFSAPNTTVKKIGIIGPVEDEACLVVNATSTATACVNIAAMRAADTPCLIIGLTEHFIDLADGNFNG
jgi:hypothetical protein